MLDSEACEEELDSEEEEPEELLEESSEDVHIGKISLDSLMESRLRTDGMCVSSLVSSSSEDPSSDPSVLESEEDDEVLESRTSPETLRWQSTRTLRSFSLSFMFARSSLARLRR